jgi:hypothetical protein
VGAHERGRRRAQAVARNQRRKAQDADTPGDAVQALVRRSREEDRENVRKAQHNAKAATEDMLPYQNDAVCNLIEAVDRLLSPNASVSIPGGERG